MTEVTKRCENEIEVTLIRAAKAGPRCPRPTRHHMAPVHRWIRENRTYRFQTESHVARWPQRDLKGVDRSHDGAQPGEERVFDEERCASVVPQRRSL